MKKRDFRTDIAGNVDDRKNVVKKSKSCSEVSCTRDKCDTKCRKHCILYGEQECKGKPIRYGSTVTGKQSARTSGKNTCCCVPVCHPEGSEGQTQEEEEKEEKGDENKNQGTKEDDTYVESEEPVADESNMHYDEDENGSVQESSENLSYEKVDQAFGLLSEETEPSTDEMYEDRDYRMAAAAVKDSKVDGDHHKRKSGKDAKKDAASKRLETQEARGFAGAHKYADPFSPENIRDAHL